MNLARYFLLGGLPTSSFLILALPGSAETFRVATYNAENYLDAPALRRHAKSPESKAAVRESIRAFRPDVLALQEMGTVSALDELRGSLKAGGLDLPHEVLVTGFDTNIHVAILSKFPFEEVRCHTNDSFLLDGHRFHVSRGFGEVRIQVATNYSFTLIAAHLKSKRPIPQADEAGLRLEEAKVLREKIDSVFANEPAANLVVLGDLNDTKDAASTRLVMGRGRYKLVDTRPAERPQDGTFSELAANQASRVTWTHFYAMGDTYSRLDYILLSPGMAAHWVTNQSYVLFMRDWAAASDHRPVVATFDTGTGISRGSK